MLGKLLLNSVQIGSPRMANEGMRIGTVRFLPRGIYKTDYARLNYFDVWLPSLAPSRELLAKFKGGNLTSDRLFARYRVEMRETEPFQTIKLLSELAKRTPISIGCYCEDESRCHRSVLVQLIRQAGGESMARDCIYTIVHPDKLDLLRIETVDDGSTAAGSSEEARSANADCLRRLN